MRYFGKHGLAAAGKARIHARQAARMGERDTYEYWTELCRALDRRKARNFDVAIASPEVLNGSVFGF